MKSVLSVQNISKSFGATQALCGVSLEVPRGSAFGILGPNGSGKTTLLGIITDVLKATGGCYSWDPGAALNRKNIGTLLETPNFYHYLSGERNLKIAAAIKGCVAGEANRVLEMVHLTAARNTKVSAYSLGMKQRLAIAAALMGDPEVLLLDEPTNGLDPAGITDLRALLLQLHAAGKTVIIASHLLDEIEKVCTHVAILQGGRLLVAGGMEEVLRGEDVVAVSAAGMESLHDVLSAFPGVLRAIAKNNRLNLHFQKGAANLEGLNRYCLQKGIFLDHLQLHQSSLESRFLELTHKN